MGKFEDLYVWKASMELVTEIYLESKTGMLSNDFGLKNQMQRSAVSIPSNIAEGDELSSQKQSIKHFYIAKGSCAELFTQVFIAEKTGYMNLERASFLKKTCKEISAKLQSLINYRLSNMEKQGTINLKP